MNRISCEKYLPWTTTSAGEINDACVEKQEGDEEDDLEKEQ